MTHARTGRAACCRVLELVDPRDKYVRYVTASRLGWEHLRLPLTSPAGIWLAELQALGLEPVVDTYMKLRIGLPQRAAKALATMRRRELRLLGACVLSDRP